MTRGALVLFLGLSCATGCHKSAPDAVPPAPSGGLAPAPPGALGAHAASLGGGGGTAATPPAGTPGVPDEEQLPPGPEGGTPAPPTLTPAPPGSGVAL